VSLGAAAAAWAILMAAHTCRDLAVARPPSSGYVLSVVHPEDQGRCNPGVIGSLDSVAMPAVHTSGERCSVLAGRRWADAGRAVALSGGVRVGMAPGMSGGAVAVGGSGVLGDNAQDGGGREPGEQADLVRFGSGVVVGHSEPSDTAVRDTVLTWSAARSGALTGLTTVFRNIVDGQPTLAVDGRFIADGTPETVCSIEAIR
jgi:hypothetical protein